MSKKYVIEIKPEYEDTTKGVMVLGARESNLYVDTLSIEDLEELNSDYINEHYGELQDEAYQRGFEDGKKSGYEKGLNAVGTYRKGHAIGYDEGYEDGKNSYDKNKTYQRGLEDAWEAARRIVVDTDHGGLALGTLSEIFGTQSYSYIMRENTAQDAIAKLKTYEDKQKDRIEVGDEVIAPCGKAVVTLIETDDLVHYLYSGGDYGCIEPQKLKKTGKHYDIQSILEAMRK